MAPRRGGSSSGSGSGGSSISIGSCPNAFSDIVLYESENYIYFSTDVVYFASYCVFFVLTLIVLISMCCVRKRHPTAKKLTGAVYLLSLLCMLLSYTLRIIGTMLRECEKQIPPHLNEWGVAYLLFYYLGLYLLLVVVVWGVNNQLRERLGSYPTFFKVIYGIILGFMGLLTCAWIGLNCYNQWALTPAGLDSNADPKTMEMLRLGVAYYVFYIVSVIASGALSIMTLVSMRSRGFPYGDLLGWVIVLIFCMFIWVLFTIIEYGSYLDYNNYLSADTYRAFQYIENFFQTFSWIVLLFLAKSRAWDNTAVNNPNPQVYNNYPQQPVQYGQVPPPQQQYAYNTAPGQQYYYQQQPVYNGTPSPVNGNPHVVQVK